MVESLVAERFGHIFSMVVVSEEGKLLVGAPLVVEMSSGS